MIISTHILIFIIGLIYPIYIALIFKKTKYRIKIDEKFRLVDYKQTIFIFWTLTLLIIGNTFLDKLFLLNFYPTFNIIGIVLTVLIAFSIGLLIVSSKVTTETVVDVKEKLKSADFYFPKSRSEFVWFNLLSLSAGICEEIIFRLFMFSYLNVNINLATAFILTNVIFVLTHIGSGKQNLINSFFFGLTFTAIYYLTDNIWLPILLHSSIDMYTGFLSYQVQKLDKTVTKHKVSNTQ